MINPLSTRQVVLRALEHREECNRQAIQNDIARTQDVYRTFEVIRIASDRLAHDYSKNCFSVNFDKLSTSTQQLTKVNNILKSVIADIKKSITWYKEKKKSKQKYKRDKKPISYSTEY